MTQLTAEQKAAYLADGAACCPVCQSSDISGGHVEVSGTSAWQEVTCKACGAEWSDGYTLTEVFDEVSA